MTPNPLTRFVPNTPAPKLLWESPTTPSPSTAPREKLSPMTAATPRPEFGVEPTMELNPLSWPSTSRLLTSIPPLASRLTMAFATSELVGGTSHCKFNVPLLVTGGPTVKSEFGALKPTLVTVPLVVPGKDCPGTKLMMPLSAIDSPVSDGTLPPPPNRRLNLPEGSGVLLLTGSACHPKVSVAAALWPLSKTDVARFRGCELLPAAAVAVAFAG